MLNPQIIMVTTRNTVFNTASASMQDAIAAQVRTAQGTANCILNSIEILPINIVWDGTDYNFQSGVTFALYQ